MKKIMLALLVMLPAATFAQASYPAGPYPAALKEFFANPGTLALWIGMDFTRTKIINDPVAVPGEFVAYTFTAMEDLTAKEFKKYDVKEAFRRMAMDHDFTAVEKHNAGISASTLLSTNVADAARLKAEDISDVVNELEFGKMTGIGVLFVVESFDKTDKKVAVWVTLVDMGNKKVLLTERIEGSTSSGFSERNYWSSGIKSVIDQIKKNKYEEWKKKS